MKNHWQRFNQLREMYEGGTYTAGGITQQGPFFTPWKQWFAWRPVRTLSGELAWMRKIYRRAYEKTYVNHDDWTRYQYGSLLDVIANPDRPQPWWS